MMLSYHTSGLALINDFGGFVPDNSILKWSIICIDTRGNNSFDQHWQYMFQPSKDTSVLRT